jgi:hypothetical protein
MRRFVPLIAVLLLCCGTYCLAQVPTTGAGKAAPGGGTGGGIIDVFGSANVVAAWSTRCASATYNGNVVDVWDSATGTTTETLVTCNGAGGLVTNSPTAIATTCAVGCVAKTWYDQSSGANCSAACNVTNTTNANRPTITLSCQNSLLCLTFNGTSQCLAGASNMGTGGQPFSFSSVFNYSGGSTGNLLANNGGASQFYTDGTNLASYMNGGGAVVQTASANNPHSGQVLINGASSNVTVDGSTGSNANPGGATFNGNIVNIGANVGAANTCASAVQFYAGKIMEIVLLNGDQSLHFANATTNQRNAYGF